MPRRRRTYGLSWSWKRASGYSAAKGRLSRRLGVPLTRQGRQRKMGAMMGCLLPLCLLAAMAGSLLALL